MSVFRRCVWVLMVLCFALPHWVQAAPAEAKLQRLIVYPSEGETPAELRASGVAVEDYGSYWLVKANRARSEEIRRARGARALAADYLDRIELLSVQFDTTQGEPEVPAQLRETSKPAKYLRLVQFTGPVQSEWVEMLKSAGHVKVISYVPNNAYLVRLDQTAEANVSQFLAPNGPVQWIGAYHPYYKIQKGLLPKRPGREDSILSVRVAIVDGPEADAAISAVRQYAFGGSSEPFVQLNHRIIQFSTRVSEIAKIAQLPDVVWIERLVPRELKDEKQDLILASRTNQLPAHSPIPPSLGGQRYLDFLFDNVAGGAAGLARFTNSALYPIVDIADTGLELGSTRTAHPAFYDLGDPSRNTRVAYATRAGYPNGSGCPSFSGFFNGAEDFCGHGTFVASIVAGYDNGTDETLNCTDTRQVPTCVQFGNNVVCIPSIATDNSILSLVRKDTEGFQRGMGVSPFGLVGATRIFSQDLTINCFPYSAIPDCAFCATSLPVLMAQEYLARARIANNSWGDILVADPDGNIVNAGLYTTDSQTYDIGVRDALLTGASSSVPGPSPLNQELIAVFAGGNAGSVGNVGGFGDILVTAPATAKNIIAVGATENFRSTGDGCFAAVEQDNTYDVSGYSAFGPTLDGRFKPDILAPGTAIFGANDYLSFDEVIDHCACTPGIEVDECHPVPGIQECLLNVGGNWPRSPGLYVCGAGTSFSAPAVSGGLQLLWWYFQNRLNILQPSPAMAKAYLLNSARYLPIVNPITQTTDTLPSIAQGMGMMDMERMFDGVPRVLRDQTTPRAIDVTLLLTNPVPQQTYFTRTGQSYELQGTIFDATKPFRVTLAWTDVAGSPAANGALVNDLDLEVSIGGRTYRGNIFAGEFSVVDPSRGVDQLNNIESVFLPAGQTGTWTVVVRAINAAGDGVPNVGNASDQDFALVVYNTASPSDVPNVNTNDACQTAASITNFPYTTSLNLSSPAFHNNHPSPSAGKGGIEAFWSLGRLSRGTTISANTFGSNFDTILSVWLGECGSLVEVTSNNNVSNTLQSAVSFTADGSNTYYLVVDKRAGIGSSLTLNVSAVVPPIVLNPNTVNFGNVLIGDQTAPQTVTYSNGSSQPARIESVSIEGLDTDSFLIFEENCESQTIQPGGNCTIRIVFVPTHEGVHTATLVVNDSQTGSPRIAVLTGNGLPAAPRVCQSAASLGFGTVAIGSSSAAQSVTFTNCGTGPLSITSATITGSASADFAITSDSCSAGTVAPGSSCQVLVVFSPTAAGGRTATLRLADNADTSPQLVSLSGTGQQPVPLVCLSSATIDFGSVAVDANSTIQSLVVTNCGSAPLNISGISLTGAGAGQFSIISDACSGSSLAPGQTCTIRLQFQPTSIGSVSATLNLADNASGNPHKVTLIGSGSGNQPDALISNRRAASTFIGNNIYNETGTSQTFGVRGVRGKKRVFFVRVQNDGSGPDSYLVEGTGDVTQGIRVAYFLGAVHRESLNITEAVKAGTFRTSTIAAGGSTSDSTLIRVEITVDKQAFAGFYDTLITLSSNARPDHKDAVKAAVVVQ